MKQYLIPVLFLSLVMAGCGALGSAIGVDPETGEVTPGGGFLGTVATAAGIPWAPALTGVLAGLLSGYTGYKKRKKANPDAKFSFGRFLPRLAYGLVSGVALGMGGMPTNFSGSLATFFGSLGGARAGNVIEDKVVETAKKVS